MPDSFCPRIFVFRSFLEFSLSCMFLTNCSGQNDRIDHRIISQFCKKYWFSWRTVTNKKWGWVSHFSSSFIIDLFHHVWEIQTSLSWIYSCLVRPGTLWLPLAPFGGPRGCLRMSSRFNWKLDEQMCSIHCKTQQHLRFLHSPADPADPAFPVEVVSWSGVSTPTSTAPGVRMTWVSKCFHTRTAQSIH